MPILSHFGEHITIDGYGEKLDSNSGAVISVWSIGLCKRGVKYQERNLL